MPAPAVAVGDGAADGGGAEGEGCISVSVCELDPVVGAVSVPFAAVAVPVAVDSVVRGLLPDGMAAAVAFAFSQSSWANSRVVAWSEASQEPCMQLNMVGTWLVHMQGMSRRAQEPWLVEMHVCWGA